MFDNLNEMNLSIIKVADEIVSIGTNRTGSGNYIANYDDVEELIGYEDYLANFDIIADELSSRPEVLELDAYDEEFDIIFGLDYCPNYDWVSGDEEVFGCSYDEWLQKPTLPILQKSKEETENTYTQSCYLIVENELEKKNEFASVLVNRRPYIENKRCIFTRMDSAIEEVRRLNNEKENENVQYTVWQMPLWK